MKGLRYYLCFCLLCYCINYTSAQKSDAETSESNDTPLLKKPAVDSLDKKQVYTTALDFYHLRTEPKDSLDFDSHQYDPTRKLPVVHYSNLGNLGSAHRPHLFQSVYSKGLDLGQHQYDLYKRRFADFKFYDSKTPITEFNYSQGFGQFDGIFQALVGINFAKGIKMSLDFQRINQSGRFQHQRAKHTSLGFGIWYESESGFYDGLYQYSSNSIVQEDNGGVINYDTLNSLPDPITVPVNLTGALTTHRERVISAQNHFHLNYRSDSIPKRFLVDLIHTGQYKNSYIKFYDDNVEQSNDYYGDFLVDDRGMRHYIFLTSFDNRADLQFRVNAKDEENLSSQVLRVGIQYRHTNLMQEPLEKRYNEVFFNASTRLTFTPQLDLRANGYIALSGQTGDFNLNGDLRYKISTLGRVTAHVGFYQRSPNILEQSLYISKSPIWNNDFKKPTSSHLGLEASFDKIRLLLRGGLRVIGNHVYYDENRTPIQVSSAQDIWQLLVQKEISVGKIGLHISFALQEAPDFLALPSWIGQSQLYYTDFWFKNNMQVRTGVDIRITQAYQGANYFPVTGQFHLDNSLTIDQYPALDVFFDMQIRETFRAFFKIENISALFIDDVYAHAVYYPQFETYFRLGFWMKLFN